MPVDELSPGTMTSKERRQARQRTYLTEATRGLREATARYEAAVTRHVQLRSRTMETAASHGGLEGGVSRFSLHRPHARARAQTIAHNRE